MLKSTKAVADRYGRPGCPVNQISAADRLSDPVEPDTLGERTLGMICRSGREDDVLFDRAKGFVVQTEMRQSARREVRDYDIGSGNQAAHHFAAPGRWSCPG